MKEILSDDNKDLREGDFHWDVRQQNPFKKSTSQLFLSEDPPYRLHVRQYRRPIENKYK